MIQPPTRRSFAKVLSDLRCKAKIKDSETEAKSIQCIRVFCVLLELNYLGDRAKFTPEMKAAVREKRYLILRFSQGHPRY